MCTLLFSFSPLGSEIMLWFEIPFFSKNIFSSFKNAFPLLIFFNQSCQLGNLTFFRCFLFYNILSSLIRLSVCVSEFSLHCLIVSFKTVGLACFIRRLISESTSAFRILSLVRVFLTSFGAVVYYFSDVMSDFWHNYVASFYAQEIPLNRAHSDLKEKCSFNALATCNSS